MFGGKKVEQPAIRQHKQMAGAGEKGNFGVDPYPTRDAMHPDAVAHTGRKPELEDSARGIPPGMGGGKGSHARQAAPDHGPRGHDHHRREGKL
jgi:hypothetical protein